jgi:hypothetical protein
LPFTPTHRGETDALEARVAERTAELSRQKELLQSILSNMGDAVVVVDVDDRVVVFNAAAERVFDMPASDALFRPFADARGLCRKDRLTLLLPDDLPFARALRGENVDDLEMFVRQPHAPDGLWTRVTGRPLKDARGKLSGAVMSVATSPTGSGQRSNSRSFRRSAWKSPQPETSPRRWKSSCIASVKSPVGNLDRPGSRALTGRGSPSVLPGCRVATSKAP